MKKEYDAYDLFEELAEIDRDFRTEYVRDKPIRKETVKAAILKWLAKY